LEDRWRKKLREMQRAVAGSHVVYFIQRADGLVKIGFTTDLSTRLSAHAGAQGPIVLLGLRAGGRLVEGELHRKFRNHLAEAREWFYPVPQVLAEANRSRYKPSVERHGTGWMRHARTAA
jgi:outer membrane protein assembly factor BamB